MDTLQKRLGFLCCICAAACLLNGTVFADEEQPAAETVQADSADDAAEAPDWTMRTEDEVFAKMKKAAENDRLEFWVWDEAKLDAAQEEKPEDVFALVNKANGYVWWSSPVNAGGDRIAAPVLRSELASGLVITAAQINERAAVNARSGDALKTLLNYADIPDGIKVTYFFRKTGIKIPVSYVLKDDHLEVSVNTGEISEKHGTDDEKPVLAQSLALMNAFGAADSEEEGYFVIPDGSGAIIRFNNQKYTAKTYRQMIYGSDTTAVPKTKAPVTEGVSLPVYGICKGENALMAVAAEGEGNCELCADVSGTGQSNTEYNRCYFRFILRSADQYYLGGDQLNPLDVYEKQLSERRIRVCYYPMTAADADNADGSETLDYVDIAARYRRYLLEDEKVPVRAKANDAQLYVDLYGGCMKQRNVLGFPVFMKTEMTSYADMQRILEQLRAAGADDLTVTLNRWTNAGISGKVDCKAKASGTLGGKSDFNALKQYLDSNQIAWYPAVSNTAFYSGNGYWSLSDTAVRVSGAFARIVNYERAYGIPYGDKKTMSLLSPAAFPELYQKLAQNYKKNGLSSVCIGAPASTLYGDYGKKSSTPRDRTMQYLEESMKLLHDEVGPVLSEHPNAYALPYTDTITDLPLSSSGFNLFDADIPFYQTVMHGVIPFSTKAINGSADAEQLVLLALASGSNLRFDLLAAETSDLKDTDFDIYYYAYADYWIDSAVQYYRFAKDILAAVSDAQIISMQRSGDIITTTYDNGAETVVDLSSGTVTFNGETRRLRDYTGKERSFENTV